MKIVCDACSAKYSIADDKVKGKVFKIRCKKCSNIIVVRGTAGAGASDEPPAPQFDQKDTRVYDYGYDEQGGSASGADPAADADAVWHVVIDQEQVGPLTAADVQAKFAAGQIDAETYVWREGFADWQPLASIDVFAHLGASAGGGSSGADAVASMFGAAGGDDGGTMRSNPDDLFAARGAAAAPADDGDVDGDLFGARGAASAPAAAAAPSSDKGKLRGERNENSVLFSLGNLAALASDAPRAQAASSSSASSSSSGAAQHGGGEGSGLIDIRSMASAYLGPQGAKKQQTSNVGSIDDLPVFSAAAFSEPAVIMPVPARGGNNKTMMLLMAGVAALAVIAIVLVLVVFLGDKDDAAPTQIAASPTPSDSQKVVAPDEGKADPAAGDPKDDGAGDPKDDGANAAAVEPPKAEDPPPAAEDDKKDDDKKETRRTSTSDRRDDKRDSKKDEKKEDKKEVASSSSSGSCPDEVGCLLAEKPPSCCAKYSKGKKTAEKKTTSSGGGGGGGDSDAPESLDSGLIKSGVGKVKSKIFACGDKYPSAKGTLKLAVKVNPAGSVTSVDVVNSPDPGLGKCAASAMKGAKFTKTQRGGSFKYPFNF